MTLIVQWRGGDDVVTIASAQRVGFFGDNFGESIPLNNYQDTTAATDDNGTINYGALPNVKFVNTTNGDWGNGSQAMTSLPSGSATLHISLHSGSATRLQAIRLIAYSGSLNKGPKNSIVQGYEVGGSNTSWTQMSGSAQPLVLTPHSGSAQSTHDYYVALSATPTVTGVNTSVSLAIYAEWY